MSLDFKENVILATYTTFGIGGPADYFVKAASTEDIIQAVSWAKEKNIPFFILGLGANILVGDRGFRGLVIKNESKNVNVVDLEITAESGITIKELIDITSKKGLSGLEHFAGIPSTLGGALWQNLHFLSPDRKETVYIGDLVESADILKSQKTQNTQRIGESDDQNIRKSEFQTVRNSDNPSFPSVLNVDKNYFKFAYDYSVLHDTKDIVLSAVLKLSKEDPKIIQERIDANLKWRNEKHPEYAWRSSAGSVFKKIEGYGAGRLIQEVGLKGFVIGGAKFSEKHANFIVNSGGAKASDIRALIELAQKKVKEKLNLDLQTEISFIGEF